MTDDREKPGRGRPRSDRVHKAILEAALKQIVETGFRTLTIDMVAVRAGVGKMTVYRRWPNKAALVMDAFLTLVGPGTRFPEAESALTSIRLQMRLQAAFFRSDYGRIIQSLLGEAQFDPEVAEAFRTRWIVPRRQMTRIALNKAVQEGDLRPDIDFEVITDLLYGPIYYRLQIGTGPLDANFTDSIFDHVMKSITSHLLITE